MVSPSSSTHVRRGAAAPPSITEAFPTSAACSMPTSNFSVWPEAASVSLMPSQASLDGLTAAGRGASALGSRTELEEAARLEEVPAALAFAAAGGRPRLSGLSAAPSACESNFLCNAFSL